MDSPVVKSGCRDILRFMGIADLKRLLATVTNGQIHTETDNETIDAIVNFEQTPSGFLRRQKVTRQQLFQYLVRQDQCPNPKADKDALVNSVLDLWESQGAKVRFQPIVPVDQLQCRSPPTFSRVKPDPRRSNSYPPAKPQPSYPTDHQPTYQELKPVTRAGEASTTTYLDLTPAQQNGGHDLHQMMVDYLPAGPVERQILQPVPDLIPHNDMKLASQQPMDFISELGLKFSSWFFGLLNQQRSAAPMINEWGSQHFYPDCHLSMVCKTMEVSQETFDGADLVRQRLEALVREEDILFNPNLDFGGVKSWGEAHGLVAVLVCGTLHRGELAVGMFEQKFGLIRDPLMDNNWRIKFTDLRIVQQEVHHPPTLQDTQTLLSVTM